MPLVFTQFSKACSSLFSLLFPRFCKGCGRRLTKGEAHVCVECVRRLTREYAKDWTTNNRIARYYELRQLQKMGAFARYRRDSIAARIVQQLKYHNHPELGEWMGRWAYMELADTGLFDGIDVIVPIPLTRRRLRHRGYNQSELIALGISKETGIPVNINVLRRTTYRKPQARTDINKRFDIEKIKGIFALDTGAASLPPDTHILLVDDVMTTGATMHAAMIPLQELQHVKFSTFAWAWTGVRA